MKKKIIALLLCIAIMATFVISAAGCGIIEKNEERVAKQHMITVKYQDLSDGVTENEVYSYLFTTSYYYYISNYGMDAEYILDMLGNNLAQQKLAVLAARVYFADQKGVSHDSDISVLLRNDEYSDCIDKANDQLKSQYKTYYDDIMKKVEKDEAAEDENKDDEDDDWKEETIEARTTKTKSDDKDYTGADIAAADVSRRFFDYMAEEVANDKNKQKALSKVTKLLEDNYTSYDDILEDALESAIIDKYKREVVEAGFTAEQDEIVAKYDETYERNLLAYKDNRDAFETAISSNMGTAIYQPYADYGYVLQILIKYNDEQTADIEKYKDFADEDALNTYMINAVAGIKVNVSNPDYDADADEDDCTDPDYDIAGDKNLTMKGVEKPEDDAEALAEYNKKRLNVINQHACSDPNCPLKAYVELDVPVADILARIKADVDAATTTEGKIKAFESWIYKVNDDSGIFNSNGYLIKPEGQKSSYVDSFTALGRELIVAGDSANWSVSDARIAELQDADVKGSELIVNDNGITYCVSTYGIHIMMVHYRGVTSDELATSDKLSGDRYINYLSDKPLTVYEPIKQNLISEKGANAYNTYYQSLYKNANDSGNFKWDEKLKKELIEKVKTDLGVSD